MAAKNTAPFGERLRAARAANGLSQRALADKLGVDPSTISLIEAGKRMPSFPLLQKINAALPDPAPEKEQPE